MQLLVLARVSLIAVAPMLALPATFAVAAEAKPVASAGAAEQPAKADKTDKSSPGKLSAAEKAAGFQLLFDGKTTKGWRGWLKETFPERGWLVKDGVLLHEKNSKDFRAGDILTVEQFDNFDLRLEVKLTPKGNSGVKYLVTEDKTPRPDGKPAQAVS